MPCIQPAHATKGLRHADRGLGSTMLMQNQPLILIVDDRPEEIRTVIELLRNEQLRVNVATDMRQGYERAVALVPDLILLDVRMPNIDGLAGSRLLKESPRTRDIPIIFLSSAGAEDERLEGLLHGAVDYVLKPCLPAEVLARIRIHLRLTPRVAAREPSTPQALLSPEEVILRAAMRFIGANLSRLPSLADIAHKVGTHDKKLSAIFRQHLGMTVFAWIRDERLRLGRELLTDSRMNMQDIAEQVGFRSACNFTTAFRERTGVTPSTFRRGLQERGGDAAD
jgi:DNA-binding response OmpR family regulator